MPSGDQPSTRISGSTILRPSGYPSNAKLCPGSSQIQRGRSPFPPSSASPDRPGRSHPTRRYGRCAPRISSTLSSSIRSSASMKARRGARLRPSFPSTPSRHHDIDIFSLAAALSLPYDALATLNRLRNAEVIPGGSTLLIPSLPGIFVAKSPEGDLRVPRQVPVGRDSRAALPRARIHLRRYVDFVFLPRRRIPSIRARLLPRRRISLPPAQGSDHLGFRRRLDPFTGRSLRFHTGIDIGAPSAPRSSRPGRAGSTRPATAISTATSSSSPMTRPGKRSTAIFPRSSSRRDRPLARARR